MHFFHPVDPPGIEQDPLAQGCFARVDVSRNANVSKSCKVHRSSTDSLIRRVLRHTRRANVHVEPVHTFLAAYAVAAWAEHRSGFDRVPG